jgi:hypothetical protein
MTGESGGDRDPGQRSVTADELLADLMRSGSTLDDHTARTKELTTVLGGITTQGSGFKLQREADERALGDVPQRPDRLSKEWAADASRLRTDQLRKILEGYGPGLQGVIGYVFGDEEGKLTDLPPTEQLEQVVNLNTRIRMAAGQPIVVLKPGKTWLDIGLLERPQELNINTGLQRSDNLRDTTSSIVLPIYKGVTVDIKTGKEPEPEYQQHDDELQARNQRTIDEQGESTRPVIDPLNTRVLLTAEDAPSTQADLASTYILVGYTQLQQTLNRILGFDMSPTDSDNDESVSKFYAVLQIQKRLEEAGIVFDIDYIDGYLAYRIDALKREMQEGGPLKPMSSAYHEPELAEMEQKFARLTDAGWISKPD